MSDHSPNFVEDGPYRAFLALEPTIRAEVAADYAERLARASIFTRWRLWLAMRREVTRRFHERVSPYSLY